MSIVIVVSIVRVMGIMRVMSVQKRHASPLNQEKDNQRFVYLW